MAVKPALKLKDSTFTAFKRGVEDARKKTREMVGAWQKNVQATFGDVPKDYQPGQVLVNKDYPRVKQKASQLFFRVPEVQLKPLRPGAAEMAPVAAAALNQTLSRDMGVSYMVDEVLTDVLCPSGIGVSEISYQAVTKTVKDKPPEHQETPDEVFAGLVESKAAEYIDVEVPTYECYSWNRVSPTRLLYPVEFDGSSFDDAPWLGLTFELSEAEARRQFKLSKADLDAARAKVTGPEDSLANDDKPESVVKKVSGVTLWYRACYFDEEVGHKDHFRKLVWFDGMDKPVVHEDSPYQWYQDGKLYGVRRYPIRVLTLTYVPDRPLPPSDVTITRPQVLELSQSRTLQMEQRRRNLPVRGFDSSRVDEATESRLMNGEIQDWLPFDGPAQDAIWEIAKANYPRENFEIDRVITTELDEAWAMGGPQMGAQTKGETTKAEIQEISSAVATRLDYDRAKVLRWFVEGAEVVFGLMQRFADANDFAELVGTDGAKRLVEWNKQNLMGQYAFEARPDAALRLDAAADRQQALNLFQMLRQDPFVDGRKLLQEVLRTHNMAEDVLLPQPPQPKPEPPNVSFRFSEEALDPTRPQALLVYDLLKQMGMGVDPQILQQARDLAQKLLTLAGQNPVMALADTMRLDIRAQGDGSGAPVNTEHGGMAPKVQPMSKSQMTEGRIK